jgi:hypothetical protein
MTKRMQAALRIARSVGLPATWPNLRTIEAALVCESEFSSISLPEAAEAILKAAREQTHRPAYRIAADWEAREIFRLNVIDRFWFEDGRWREKYAYAEFLSEVRQAEGATLPREAESVIMAEEQSR